MEENYENNTGSGNSYGQNYSDQNHYGQNNYNPNGYYQTNYNQTNYNPYDQSNYEQNNYGFNGYANSNGYYGNTGSQNTVYGIWEPTPATEAVRESGKSFPFLFGTICYTLTMLLSIVTLFFYNTRPVGYFSKEAEIVQAAQLIGGLIGLIPLALVVVGMWMFFASCVGNRKIPSTTGITLNRGAIITYIVLTSIIIGFYFIVMGIFVLGLTMSKGAVNSFMYYEVAGERTEFLAGVGAVIVLFVAILLILVLTLFYFIKMLKTTRVISNVLKTGRVVKNISMYHIVINIIVVVGNVFIMAVSFITVPYMDGAMPLAIQAALSAISYGSVTVALLMLRSRLRVYIQPRG